MKSISDRMLFDTVIRQKTKTGFLNLTDLQKCFESIRINKGWTNKNIQELISRTENIERIYYILNKQGVINLDLSKFIEVVNNKGIATSLKSFGVYRTTGARQTKTTWVDPYIWILIALELSPEMYANAVIWLTDKLILNRIEAGNYCVALNASIKKFNPTAENYMQLSKAINYITFNNHFAGIRDTGSKDQLKELASIENKMAFAIDMGYINSFDMLLTELRKIWNVKYK